MKTIDSYRLFLSLFAVITAFSIYACSNACEYNRDCPLDRVCLAGACTMSCAHNPSACSGGEVCVAGNCVNTCIGDGDCRGSMYCAPTGICTAPITSNNDVNHGPKEPAKDPNGEVIPDNNKPDSNSDNGQNEGNGSNNSGDATSDNNSQNS